MADAATYAVYRDSSEAFVPCASALCATIAAPTCAYQESPPPGAWYYLVCAVDAAGHVGGYSARFEVSGGSTPVEDAGLPRALAITGVAPNPFNPRVTVRFSLPSPATARVQVFDLRGRLVRDLVNGHLAAGSHQAVWDGSDRQGRQVATGVYFVCVDDGHATVSAKIVMAK